MAKKSDFTKAKKKHPTQAAAIDAMYNAIKNAHDQTPQGRLLAGVHQHVATLMSPPPAAAALPVAQQLALLKEGFVAYLEDFDVLEDAVLNGIQPAAVGEKDDDE